MFMNWSMWFFSKGIVNIVYVMFEIENGYKKEVVLFNLIV